MARNKHPEETIERILDVSFKLFMEKGYEQTTIQDIVDELGDLSKGAIYHHFKSKEDIINAVISRSTTYDLLITEIISREDLNGLEKLKLMIRKSLDSKEQTEFAQAVPNLLKNPKFLAEQLHDSVEIIAPALEPFIQEGIDDGSIHSKYPHELAQALMILLNLWLNPMVFSDSKEDVRNKFRFLKDMTESLGIPLLDDDMLDLLTVYTDYLL
ncbi:TetR/AcrR family transcriptional regulator [Diplocloster agilis]|uniref:TetR/AcrR family transcriptional regulator n=1 Tax=Diplocloster agilis TaxID=2850323 RepID=A0A949NG46_9FIRM|nr:MULTISPECIES: TetR/AcrR family transcriptional regulator [Lachnospiraceae]MBU9735978.1 TetR/AcrR family transcriptional regulator [Diplocloster agilis]MBU9745439.1 TetR/AcrR family transcriptional regulator [Diplocloster agilis]MCU6732887.1 TetR/AcrR family transcriptional regulator [Suonthocola fibrivorans]SCI66069.1 HTH-type transcriptional repressor KstR2 [uncultured Clostridium sp.]